MGAEPQAVLSLGQIESYTSKLIFGHQTSMLQEWIYRACKNDEIGRL